VCGAETSLGEMNGLALKSEQVARCAHHQNYNARDAADGQMAPED
jgi:hypothetical protein